MANLHPLLGGGRGARAGKVPAFPQVEDPQDHILAARCGHLGIVPQPSVTEASVKPPGLGIADPRRARPGRGVPHRRHHARREPAVAPRRAGRRRPRPPARGGHPAPGAVA